MRKSESYRDNAILVALTMLNPKHPAFTGSAEVRAALENTTLRGYLEAWVFPALETATGDTTMKWNRSPLASKAARIRYVERRSRRIAELVAMRARYVTKAKGNLVTAAMTWDKDTNEGLELTRLLGEERGPSSNT